LASYPFSEIEVEHECDPKPQIDNLILLSDSGIFTRFILYSRVSIESFASTS